MQDTELEARTTVRTVTAVVDAPGRTDRFRVEFDDKESVVLSSRLISELGVRTGMVLGPDGFSGVVVAAQRLSVMDLAIRILGRGPRSMMELRRRLLARGENADSVKWALARLEADGIAGDESFSIQFSHSRLARGESRAAVLSGLLRAGVKRDLAERVVADAVSEDGRDEVDAARTAVVKKVRSLKGVDKVAAKRRMTAFLRRRGYGASVIRDALRKLGEGSEDQA